MAAVINKGGVRRDNAKAAHFLAVFGVRDYSKETTTATGSPAKETSAPSCSSVSFLPPRDTAIDAAESSVPPGQPNLDELDPIIDADDECGAGDDGLGPAARKELLQDPHDVPDEPRCGLWANDQLHHRQPDTVVSNGGSHFDLNLGQK